VINGNGKKGNYRWFDKTLKHAAIIVTAGISFVGLLSWQTDSMLGYDGGPFQSNYDQIENSKNLYKAAWTTCAATCPSVGVTPELLNSDTAEATKLRISLYYNQSVLDQCPSAQPNVGYSPWLNVENDCQYPLCMTNFFDGAFYAQIWANSFCSVMFYSLVIWLMAGNDIPVGEETAEETAKRVSARGVNTTLEFFSDALGWSAAYGVLNAFNASMATDVNLYNYWDQLAAMYGFVIAISMILWYAPPVLYSIGGEPWTNRADGKREAVREFTVGNFEIVIGQTLQGALRASLIQPPSPAPQGLNWLGDGTSYIFGDVLIACLFLIAGMILVPFTNAALERLKKVYNDTPEDNTHIVSRGGNILGQLVIDSTSRIIPFTGAWWIVQAIRHQQDMMSFESGAPCAEHIPNKVPPPPIASTAKRFQVAMIVLIVVLAIWVLFDYFVHVWSCNFDTETDEEGDGKAKKEAASTGNLKLIQNKVILKYPKYISMQMWWRFMQQAMASYMSSSQLQFAMASTTLAFLSSEVLSHFRSAEEIMTTGEQIRHSVVHEKETAVVEMSDSVPSMGQLDGQPKDSPTIKPMTDGAVIAQV